MWREEIGKTRRTEFLGSVVWKRAACKELHSSRDWRREREGCQETDNLSVPLYRPGLFHLRASYDGRHHVCEEEEGGLDRYQAGVRVQIEVICPRTLLISISVAILTLLPGHHPAQVDG